LGTAFPVTFEAVTHYCNGPGSGHPDEQLAGLLGTRKRTGSGMWLSGGSSRQTGEVSSFFG